MIKLRSHSLLLPEIFVYSTSFQNVRLYYKSERGSLAKLAPQFAVKPCSFYYRKAKCQTGYIDRFPDQNDARREEYRSNTASFLSILLSVGR